MAKRKRSRRHKNHNNRNHFSSSRPDSPKDEISYEFNIPRNAQNYVSSLEESFLILNHVPFECSDCINISQRQSYLTKFRSHSCKTRLHSPEPQSESDIATPHSAGVIETPRSIDMLLVTSIDEGKYTQTTNDEYETFTTAEDLTLDDSTTCKPLKESEVGNGEVSNTAKVVDDLEPYFYIDNFTTSTPQKETANKLVNDCSDGTFKTAEAVYHNVLDFCIDSSTTSTPRKLNFTHSSTQTNVQDISCRRGSKRRLCKNLLPTYKVRIRNCDVNLRNVYCNQIQAPADIQAYKNCVQVFTSIQQFHANYTYYVAKKMLEVCWWLGITFRFGIISIYNFYKDHRCSNALPYEICVLNETIKALVIDNTLLRSEFHNIKEDLKEMKEKCKFQQLNAPPPPPPPPPPLPPPLAVPDNNHKPNTIKSSQKKKNERDSRPIISLEDILKVKLRKTAERPAPVRRATEPLITTSLKHIKLRPTHSKPQTYSSNETPSTESSLSNSPRSSLTHLLLTDCNEQSPATV